MSSVLGYGGVDVFRIWKQLWGDTLGHGTLRRLLPSTAAPGMRESVGSVWQRSVEMLAIHPTWVAVGAGGVEAHWGLELGMLFSIAGRCC